MRWNARKWGKIEDPKLGRTFLLCFCWIVAGVLARPLWQAILPFSLKPFVWFCYMGLEIVVWGVILLPLAKFFWRTSWRQAGMVSGIWTGQWLVLLCVLYLAAPSLIASLSASGARPQAGVGLQSDQLTGSTAEGLSGLASMFSEFAKSSDADARAASSTGVQKRVAESQSDAAFARGAEIGLKTLANSQRLAESNSSGGVSSQKKSAQSTSSGPDAEVLAGVGGMFGELAKSAEADSRAAASDGRQRRVAEAQSDVAALRAMAIGVKTAADAQRKQEAAQRTEVPVTSSQSRGTGQPDAEALAGVAGMFGELAKSAKADSRAAASDGTQRRVAEAQSEAAALRAVSIGMRTAAESQRKSESEERDVSRQVESRTKSSFERPLRADVASRDDLLRSFELADKELNVSYRKVMGRLNQSGQERLKSAQRNWIKNKENLARGESIDAIQMRLDMTIERNAELLEMLR